MNIEKRLSERTKISVPLVYTLPDREITGSSWTNDFSREGIGILTEQVLPQGSRILIRIKLEGEALPLVFQGTVSWSNRLSDGGGARYHHAIAGIKLEAPDVVSISKIIRYS